MIYYLKKADAVKPLNYKGFALPLPLCRLYSRTPNAKTAGLA